MSLPRRKDSSSYSSSARGPAGESATSPRRENAISPTPGGGSSAFSRLRSDSGAVGERYDPRLNVINDAVAHANWAEKKWSWIPDKDEGYIAAYIVREDGDKVTVKVGSNDHERVVSANDCQKMNPPKFDKVEDMAALTYLNEASVIHNLRLRYFSNLIYVSLSSSSVL
jgi:hypothetical protein